MDLKLQSKLDHNLVAKLRFKRVTNPRLLISFSAVPGSGKTTIAKQIHQTFRTLYLENDAIRKAILELAPHLNGIEDINKCLYSYLPHFYERVFELSNRTWVVDATINSYAYDFFAMAKKYKFQTYVIRIEKSKDLVKRQITERGDRPHATVADYISALPVREMEHQKFAENFESDYVVSEGGAKEISSIIDDIQARFFMSK